MLLYLKYRHNVTVNLTVSLKAKVNITLTRITLHCCDDAGRYYYSCRFGLSNTVSNYLFYIYLFKSCMLL